jgi:hypothetical protein
VAVGFDYSYRKTRLLVTRNKSIRRNHDLLGSRKLKSIAIEPKSDTEERSLTKKRIGYSISRFSIIFIVNAKNLISPATYPICDLRTAISKPNSRSVIPVLPLLTPNWPKDFQSKPILNLLCRYTHSLTQYQRNMISHHL